MRLDYDGGSVNLGSYAASSACTAVALPSKNIIGIRLLNDYNWLKFLYPCTVTEDTGVVTAYPSPIDLLTTGTYAFATLPTVTTDCYTSSWQLYRTLDNSQMPQLFSGLFTNTGSEF